MNESEEKSKMEAELPNPVIRDIRIFLRIVLVVIYYWTVGWLVRRRYAWLQGKGEAYYVDTEQKRGIWDWKKKEDLT